VLPQEYLTDPKPEHAFVYVCTIQRMAINLLGRQAIFGLGEEDIDDDASSSTSPFTPSTPSSPTSATAATRHRRSVWRATLEHFDAIKIGLTATPAATRRRTSAHKVFDYSYEKAVARATSLTTTW
jgi:type I restriction enzyme R subunit